MRPMLLLALASCSSGTPGEGTSQYMCMGGPPDAGGGRTSVSFSGSCPSSDITDGKGVKLEGEACSSPQECKQICCSCWPQSTRSAAVVLCTNGKCATKEQACCDFATSTACAPKN